MKKVFYFLFLFFISVNVVNGATTSYYIETNILENFDMHVKELKILDGTYNGFKTNLRCKNSNLSIFIGILDDFECSDIYNGTDLTLLGVSDVLLDSNDFEIIIKSFKSFCEVIIANKGD